MSEQKEKIRNVIIIGSGPAGYTAAIYCSRNMLKPLMITGSVYGGQLINTTDVENFPGYVEGVTGPEMMKQLHDQAERFGTEYVVGDVNSVDFSTQPLKVTMQNTTKYLTRSVIIATGAKARWLNAEGEAELRSRGISSCATCDGAFFKGEELLVIGGGDSCMEEATFLTRYAKKVTIVHRRDEFRASKIMLERAQKNNKIKWKTGYIVKEWLLDDKGELRGALLQNTKGGEDETIKCGGSFIAIGHVPATQFLGSAIELDKDGYIVQKERTLTSVNGVFSCGDVSDRIYKQAITASGFGAAAALDCTRWLEEQKF